MPNPDVDRYSDGNIPMAGDLIEYGAQGGRMIVSRVVEEGNDPTKIWVGRYEYSPHLAVLVARHGEPDPATLR